MEHYKNLLSALGGAMPVSMVWLLAGTEDDYFNARDIYAFALSEGGEEEELEEGQFYVVSSEGAIGLANDYEYHTHWIFIPVEDEETLEREWARLREELIYDSEHPDGDPEEEDTEADEPAVEGTEGYEPAEEDDTESYEPVEEEGNNEEYKVEQPMMQPQGQPVPPQPMMQPQGQPVPPQPMMQPQGQPVPPQPMMQSQGQPVPPQPMMQSQSQPVPPQPMMQSQGQPVPPQPMTPPQGQPQPERKKFCVQCGYQLNANAKFCPKCGTPTPR